MNKFDGSGYGNFIIHDIIKALPEHLLQETYNKADDDADAGKQPRLNWELAEFNSDGTYEWYAAFPYGHEFIYFEVKGEPGGHFYCSSVPGNSWVSSALLTEYLLDYVQVTFPVPPGGQGGA